MDPEAAAVVSPPPLELAADAGKLIAVVGVLVCGVGAGLFMSAQSSLFLQRFASRLLHKH